MLRNDYGAQKPNELTYTLSCLQCGEFLVCHKGLWRDVFNPVSGQVTETNTLVIKSVDSIYIQSLQLRSCPKCLRANFGYQIVLESPRKTKLAITLPRNSKSNSYSSTVSWGISRGISRSPRLRQSTTPTNKQFSTTLLPVLWGYHSSICSSLDILSSVYTLHFFACPCLHDCRQPGMTRELRPTAQTACEWKSFLMTVTFSQKKVVFPNVEIKTNTLCLASGHL